MYMHIHMTQKQAAGNTAGKTARKTLVRDARAALSVCAGWNARLAARRITKFLDDRMARGGLGIAQFALLAQIAAAREDTLSALAGRIGLDQSTLSRNLRALERAGLVEIASTGRDLRRRVVWLTERGARRLEQALPIWREAHTALTGLVDPEPAWRLAAASEKLVGA